MHEHTVKPFDQELQQLDKKIAQMGGLAERLLVQGLDALEKRDPKRAEGTIVSDRVIDQLERELQDQTILMIARRQPVANGLHHIMTVWKIAGDLEPIRDLVKTIAKRALAVSGENHPEPLMTCLKHMVELAMWRWGSFTTCPTPTLAATPARRLPCGGRTSASPPCTTRRSASC